MSGDRYALHHDGTWFYYLGDAQGWHGAQVAADGIPMTDAQSRDWYAADHEATVITVTKAQGRMITGYRLRDPEAASARYPLAMTQAEYVALGGGDTDDDSAVAVLYAAEYQDREPVTTEVTGPWLRLDGEPAPHDGRHWTGSLPRALSDRPEYLHLFPGCMEGFREAMKQAVEAMDRVQYCFDKDNGLEVTLQVPFDPPRRRESGTGRRKISVPDTFTRRLFLYVPFRIPGENRATAAADWDRLAAELLAEVSAADIAACPHCDGRGYVISGSENRERRMS